MIWWIINQFHLYIMHLKNVSREMRPRVGGALKDSGHLKEEKGGGRIQDDWSEKRNGAMKPAFLCKTI